MKGSASPLPVSQVGLDFHRGLLPKQELVGEFLTLKLVPGAPAQFGMPLPFLVMGHPDLTFEQWQSLVVVASAGHWPEVTAKKKVLEGFCVTHLLEQSPLGAGMMKLGQKKLVQSASKLASTLMTVTKFEGPTNELKATFRNREVPLSDVAKAIRMIPVPFPSGVKTYNTLGDILYPRNRLGVS